MNDSFVGWALPTKKTHLFAKKSVGSGLPVGRTAHTYIGLICWRWQLMMLLKNSAPNH